MEKDSSKKLKALEERAKRMKVEFIDLSLQDLNQDMAEVLGSSFARQYKLVPVKVENGTLTVAMEDPNALFLLEQLEIRTKMNIRPVLADTDDIMAAIKILYSEIVPEDISIPALEEEEVQKVIHLINPDTITWFRTLLVNAIKRDASDIHIETYESEIRVRYRIDGVIAESVTYPRQMESHISMLIKTIARMKIEKRNSSQEGFFDVNLRGRKMMIRVGTLPTRVSERFIMRITDEAKMLQSIDELGFHHQDLNLLKEIINHKQGLMIVSGPAGSGLTTTLYSLLMHLANTENVVITIEDPIEAPLAGINQIEVNQKLEMGYKECLKLALKHYPDIVMLSRTREPEVAHLIIEAALTGHLTLAGLHARDSINAVTRLRDFGIEPYFVSTPLLGILSQRLARIVCPHCAEPVEVTPEMRKEFQRNNVPEPYNMRVGKGCNHCLQTGFKGRLGIYEVLPVSESFKSMILRGSSKLRLAEQATRDGMRTLLQDGLEKVAQGLTTYDEIQRVLID